MEKETRTKFKTEKTETNYQNDNKSIRRDGMRPQLEWIKRQLEYASFTEKFSLRYSLKRGEIYEIDWGINVNAEFSNRHFGVVLADSDEFNPLVTVCPLKSNHSGAHVKSDVDLGYIEELNTKESTIAVVNQIRTVDKLRLYLRRIIGVSDYDRNRDREISVIRLENDKLNMIIEAYKKYLS